jgi:hypothetical protein
MNSNRTKYASTPTYGMQKRNFAKKQAAAQASPTPDFTQQPMPDMNAGGAPFAPQNPFGIPQGAIPGVAQGSVPGMFAAPQGAQPAQQGYGATPIPYGSGQPFMGQAVPMSGQNSYGGMNAMAPPYGMNGFINQQSPMGSAMNQQPYPQGLPQMGNTPYNNPAVQGYMPQPFPQGGAMPPSITRSEPVAGQTGMTGMPMADKGPGGFYGGAGFGGGGMPGGGNPGFQTGPYPPMMNMSGGAGGFGGRPPFGGMGGGSPAMPTPRQPFDLDKWLRIILYLVLPLLFVSSLFAAYLRYPFIIATVIALSIIWYRQSFTPALRTAITVGYLVLTIITIAMLISPNRDTTQTGGLIPNTQASAEPIVSPEAAPLSVQTTPQPAEAVGESEAEQRLATFMDYWQLNRIEDMVNLVQPSWATVQDNAASALFTVISNRTPQEYTIEGISGTSADNSRTVTMSASIDKNNGKDPVRYRFMILMVKESGEWFVDPNSLATNDIATETPSPAPGKETIVQSLQPRMTVTPIPDPQTKLYYNANGGKYYHADPNCSAVNPKFLPMASFLYKELDDAPFSSLQPCLKCGAPTQSLGKLAEQATATPAQ